MSLLKKKSSRRKRAKKSRLHDAESLSFTENENTVEELKLTEDVRECFGEGEVDEKGVVDRVRLF